nr:Aquaporin [Hymenolepis microstoma]
MLLSAMDGTNYGWSKLFWLLSSTSPDGFGAKWQSLVDFGLHRGKRRSIKVTKVEKKIRFIDRSHGKEMLHTHNTHFHRRREHPLPSIFRPPRQTTLVWEGPNDHGPGYLSHFTLPKYTQFLSTFPALFFSELIGSALITLPYYFIDPRLKYYAVTEALSVCGLVYAAVWLTYPISGSNLNPLITLAFCLTRRIPFRYLFIYWTGQFAGAGLSMGIAHFVSPLSKVIDTMGMTLPQHGISDFSVMVIECIFTFLLIIIICSGTDELRDYLWTTGDGSTLAFAYALAYMINHMALANITGCGINPFRSIVPSILHGKLNHVWPYVIGPVLGSFLASIFYEVVLSDDACWIRTKYWVSSPRFHRNYIYSDNENLIKNSHIHIETDGTEISSN